MPALGGFLVRFFVEILVVRPLHWLQAMWGFPVIWGIVVGAPLLPFGAATARQVRPSWLDVIVHLP